MRGKISDNARLSNHEETVNARRLVFGLTVSNKKRRTALNVMLGTFVSSEALCLSSFLFLLLNTDRGFGPPGRLRFRRDFSSVVESRSFSSVSFSCFEGSRRETWTCKNRKVMVSNTLSPFFLSPNEYTVFLLQLASWIHRMIHSFVRQISSIFVET